MRAYLPITLTLLIACCMVASGKVLDASAISETKGDTMAIYNKIKNKLESQNKHVKETVIDVNKVKGFTVKGNSRTTVQSYVIPVPAGITMSMTCDINIAGDTADACTGGTFYMVPSPETNYCGTQTISTSVTGVDYLVGVATLQDGDSTVCTFALEIVTTTTPSTTTSLTTSTTTTPTTTTTTTPTTTTTTTPTTTTTTTPTTTTTTTTPTTTTTTTPTTTTTTTPTTTTTTPTTTTTTTPTTTTTTTPTTTTTTTPTTTTTTTTPTTTTTTTPTTTTTTTPTTTTTTTPTTTTTTTPTTTTTTTTPTTTTTTPTTTTTAIPCVCGQRNTAAKIIGGSETGVHEFPWIAAIRMNGGTQPMCCGTIVSSKHMLTRAGCIMQQGFNLSPFIEAVLGDHQYDTQSEAAHVEAAISNVIIHPGYVEGDYDNDIAIVELANDIIFPADNTIAPICLPSAPGNYEGEPTTIAGWGTTTFGGDRSPFLQSVDVTVISKTSCATEYAPLYALTDNMMCAGDFDNGGKDACDGDGGCPLMRETAQGYYEEIAFSSFGAGCAYPKFPGVYTDVTKYLSWIDSIISGATMCPPPA